MQIMLYRIKTECQVCGKKFVNVQSHPNRKRKTCSHLCHRKLVKVSATNAHRQVDPTPEEIAEMCRKIRSGEIIVRGTTVSVDSEIRNRPNRANTFFFTPRAGESHVSSRKPNS